ncbi:MAG: hypothetical protein H7844_12380 [Nitrospirae bacterium YQR-1]
MIFNNSYLKNIFVTAVLIFYLFISFNLIKYHYELIYYPFQVEQEEIGMVVSTDLLMKGINPYRFENQPMFTNIYGIGYNLVVIPVYKILDRLNSHHKGGSNYMLSHRITSAVFIVLSLSLIAFIMYCLKIDSLLICGAIIIQYATLFFYSPAIAKPDSMGMFLYLMSVFIPWYFRYSFRSVLIGIVIGLVCFYTKIYFVLGIMIVISYIFFFISKSKGVKYFSIFSIVFILTAIVMNSLCEAYFYDVVFLQYNFTKHPVTTTFKETLRFFIWNAGLAICLCLSLIIEMRNYLYLKVRNSFFNNLKRSDINISDINKPFFNKEVSIFSYSVFILLCVLVLKLGSLLSYHFELFMPFFLISILKPGDGFLKSKYVLIAFLAINIYTAYSNVLFMKIVPPDIFFRTDPSGKFTIRVGISPEEIEKLIAKSINVLVSRPFSIMALNHGKTVYDTSHNNYMNDLTPKNVFAKILFPKNFTELNEKFIEEINDKIASKYFDLLVLTINTSNGINKKYLDPWFISNKNVFDNYVVTGQYKYFIPALPDTVDIMTFEPKE